MPLSRDIYSLSQDKYYRQVLKVELSTVKFFPVLSYRGQNLNISLLTYVTSVDQNIVVNKK